MKINLLTVCVAALIISACAKKNSHDEESDRLKLDRKISATGPIGSLTTTVPVDSARAWVSNYQKWLESHNAEFTNQTLTDGTSSQMPNSRTVWFSVEQIENLINKIKANGGDGIRFYFARYGSQPSFVNTCTGEQLNYTGMNTLLLVPTKKEDCIHRDFSPGFSTLEVTSPIENRGEICPPPANCNTIGAALLDTLAK